MKKMHDNAARYFIGKDANFMTPFVIEKRFSGSYAYELSKGVFLHKDIYGVTVINSFTGVYDNDLSKLFHSIEDARDHIKKLAHLSPVGV